MGIATTNVLDRVSARMGLLCGVTPQFETALDVDHGGVLCALPALLSVGLLKHTDKHFELPAGYYRLDSLFVLLALMALCRLTSIESLRYVPPGEWGKLLGLDRIPEVRTLRAKLKQLTADDQAIAWSAALCADWMDALPEQTATLYVDGHVRVYHGTQTKLPRHYVARQRLCLRATTDYWVNASDGQPFLVINQAVDPGLIQVLETELVPRLLREVAHQPSAEVLAADRLAHRFALIFDREGYSPGLFKRLKDQRIAVVTYHKFPQANWAADEFSECTVTLASGEQTELQMAERGSRLSNGLWVREIRKLTSSGHQTAILTTDYQSDARQIAVTMFARWSQENFYKYMRQHYGLDKLLDHQTQKIPESTRVVNPAYRALDGEVRKLAAKLAKAQAEFGAISFTAPIGQDATRTYEQQKADRRSEVEALQSRLTELKAQRKATARHITVKDLPEEAQFRQLAVVSKHFIDTIKMIAYRAETAMANILSEHIARTDDTRALLRSLYSAHADLLPDATRQTLIVRLHHFTNPLSDRAIARLCHELNATETLFPGTNLRLIFQLGAAAADLES